MSRIIALVLVAFSCAALADTPSIDSVRSKLWHGPQLVISGRQALFNGGTPSIVVASETFELKFDRASNRIRLSQVRHQREGKETRFEAWGDKDCLNLLRVEELGVRLRECAKATDLPGFLSEGIGIDSASPIALRFLVENVLLAGPPYSVDKLSLADGSTRELVTTDARGTVNRRAWLSGDLAAIEHLQLGDGRTLRASLTTTEKTLTDADFHYAPSEELRILAALKSPLEDPTSVTKLEALAAKGSRRAEMILRMRTMGMLMFGGGRGKLDLDQSWTDLERLAELGMTQALTVRGRWLASADDKDLPKRIRAIPKDQRVEQGKALIWKAARLCDDEAYKQLVAGYQPRMPGVMQGDSFLEPNIIKLQVLAHLKEACNEKAGGPELKRAAAEFADPFPH